ncbi:MAG: class I SAM-dependent methyltransferase, partial [Clostridiales bacterium]|jgi:16S rRNA (guanine527-N7)-methyltransferase|nr:class I SAM-dependent methyltransferase [Clostridiales bacterium]
LNFLDEVIQSIGIKNTSLVHIRLEDAGRAAKFREKYDVVTARAVARMSVLAEYCLPLVKPGGYFYAMKGLDGEHETREARVMIEKMGGSVARIEWVRIRDDFADETLRHSVVVIQKIKQTPKIYPRR